MLTTDELLRLTDQKARQSRIEWALELVSIVFPERDWMGWASLPVGKRDRALIQIRISYFGESFEAVARCPGCQEEVEYDVHLNRILDRLPGTEPGWVTVLIEGRMERFRPFTSLDLVHAGSIHEVDQTITALLALCWDSGNRPRSWVLPYLKQEGIQQALSHALAAEDPAAELTVELECGLCRHLWEELIDPPAILRQDVQEAGERVLEEVATLARFYGWSERDILAMPPARRARYLERAWTKKTS